VPLIRAEIWSCLEALKREGQAILLASAAARRDFDRVQSISDVVALFRERASMSFKRFSLENYIQTRLGTCAHGRR
jgi:hypothetical protein